MSMMPSEAAPFAPSTDHEQKMAALGYLHEAWIEAKLDGIDEDCFTQACLFKALSELVGTYGEQATATFAAGLSARITNGEFSTSLPRQ